MMIKWLIGLALILFLLSNISAIIISEVELNPAGTDAGNEWVEFYSEEEISLDGYRIVNNDGKEINLSDNFSGYFVYTFPKQWLDNSNESVSLFNGSELIDKTDSFDDSKNDDLTWQLCGETWKFISSTKGQENNCTEQIIETPEENTTPNTTEQTEDNSITTETSSTVENTQKTTSSSKTPEASPTAMTLTLDTINLNSKDIKSGGNNENLGKNLALGGIVTFCVLFGSLFFLKFARRKAENEFR